MYKLLRNFLFILNPETAHYFSMNLLKLACSITPFKNILTRYFQPKNKTTRALGLVFKNPVGLGAGFDKNARYLRELEVLGFGFVEIGTVTPKPQAGNDKPRLFRLPKDKALINRMGFNNDGLDAITERLRQWRKENPAAPGKMLVGGNIGKNKVTDNEEAWKDYEVCFRSLHPYVDFFVVNVSSPNTPGLRALQEKPALKKILSQLQEINYTQPVQRPILLKIAPDLERTQIDDVIELAKEINLDGLVATNTSISRENLTTSKEEVDAIGAGGLSGLPVQQVSTAVLKYIHDATMNSMVLIGSGGIFTGPDAVEKMDAGADLVEVWTGFIYEGPFIVKNIMKEL
jgi:dihydroorotate dehydrogenase